MTIINPLPYECVPVPNSAPTTPDIWGVYPENARLRQEVERKGEAMDELMKTLTEQAHEIRCLKDRSDYNATMFKNQFHAINQFFKWVLANYEIDKEDDIWEMLDGMFADGLLVDPRKRVYRIRVTKKDIDEYDIEFPWEITDDRATEILRTNMLNGEFTRNNFQDVGYLGDVPINVVAHSHVNDEWETWNRGQLNSNGSPW